MGRQAQQHQGRINGEVKGDCVVLADGALANPGNERRLVDEYGADQGEWYNACWFNMC